MNRFPAPRRALGLSALALASLLAGPSLSARAANSVHFRFNYAVGMRYAELQVSTTTQKFSMTAAGSSQGFSQDTRSIDTYMVSLTITKVYPDGSADARITFPSGKHAEGGKTVAVPLAHYYRIQRIAANGETLSTRDYGASTVPAALRDSIPSTHTSKFPAAPVAVGDHWSESRTMAPFGTLTLHTTLLAIGSHMGHPVATIRSSLRQPVRFTNQGLTFAGMFLGSQDAQTYVDTIGNAAVTHSAYSFAGKLSGVVSGAAVKGTFSFSGSEVDTPQS